MTVHAICLSTLSSGALLPRLCRQMQLPPNVAHSQDRVFGGNKKQGCAADPCLTLRLTNQLNRPRVAMFTTQFS